MNFSSYLCNVSLQNGIEEWRIIFWVSAIILFSSTLLFWIFGSAETQPWNEVKSDPLPEIAEEEKHINEAEMKKIATEDEEENERL